MRFIRLAVVVLFWMYADGLSADPVYYAVSASDDYNYLKTQTWHVGDADRFFKNVPERVYEWYTLERHANGTLTVLRVCSSPTGDWSKALDYSYGKDGPLTSLKTELAFVDGEGPCKQSYSVSSSGTLTKISDQDRCKDLENMLQPVKHWMNLSELPIKPKS